MNTRPGSFTLFPVKALSVSLLLLGLFALWGSLTLWGEGFLLQFPEDVDLAFPITDILINTPASILAAIGLWKLKRWGYIASQFVAGFYVYASVEIFVMMVQQGPPYGVEIFGPQALVILVALGLLFYLWRVQDLFR
jgi:hypothetical protein